MPIGRSLGRQIHEARFSLEEDHFHAAHPELQTELLDQFMVHLLKQHAPLLAQCTDRGTEIPRNALQNAEIAFLLGVDRLYDADENLLWNRHGCSEWMDFF